MILNEMIPMIGRVVAKYPNKTAVPLLRLFEASEDTGDPY